MVTKTPDDQAQTRVDRVENTDAIWQHLEKNAPLLSKNEIARIVSMQQPEQQQEEIAKAIESNKVIGPHLKLLQEMKDEHVISKKSYQECVDWVYDGKESSSQKIAEIGNFYSKYLKPRVALHEKREKLKLKNTDALEQLQAEGGKWGAAVGKLLSDTEFFDKLHIEKREALVEQLEQEVKQVEKDMTMMAAAKRRVEKARKDKVISGPSYERWIADIDNPKISRAVKRKNFEERFEKDILRRENIQAQRVQLLKAPGLKAIEQKGGKADQERVAKLQDEKLFNEDIEVAEREDILRNLQELLPIGEKLSMRAGAAEAQIKSARGRNAISQESADEWITWIHDPSRDAKETLDSLENTLPSYLAEREQLALRRDTLLTGSANELRLLRESGDLMTQTDIATLMDDGMFLQGADIQDRKAIVSRIEDAVDKFDASDKAADKAAVLDNVPPELMQNVINIQAAIADLPDEYKPLYLDALTKDYRTLTEVMDRLENHVKESGANAVDNSEDDALEEADLKEQSRLQVEAMQQETEIATDSHLNIHLGASEGLSDEADIRKAQQTAASVNIEVNGRKADERQKALRVIGTERAKGDRTKQMSIANVDENKQSMVVYDVNTRIKPNLEKLQAANVSARQLALATAT